MFSVSLQTGAGLFTRAIVPFIRMTCLHADMYIAPKSLALRAASLPNPRLRIPGLVVALRLHPSMLANSGSNESVCLNLSLRHLYQNLFQSDDGDFLGISGDSSHNQISLMLVNTETGDFLEEEMELVSIQPAQMNVPEFQYEYQVIVGIPSEEFRRLVNNLRPSGVTVSALVTDTQVTFSVEDREVVYREVVFRKELHQCIIGGSVLEDPVTLVFGLYYPKALLDAALLSDMVWLLGQSNGPSVMLNCPVRELGNLMFYFG